MAVSSSDPSVRSSESASLPRPTQIFGRSSLRPFHHEEDSGGGRHHREGETNEYLQITEGNAVRPRPSVGWITDQSGRRRSEQGKKRFGDHHDARSLARSSSSQLASTFGQTREICIKADEDENEHEEAEEDKL